MADETAGGPETPARPLVLTPTDEWLARISDQLEDLNGSLRKSSTPGTGQSVAKKAAAGAKAGKKRAEVRGT